MKIEAACLLLWLGAVACGFLAMVLSPWWYIGFLWFGFIGYITANRKEQ